MPFIYNGKTLNLLKLDSYGVEYRITKGLLAVKHQNGRYYKITNQTGKNILNRYPNITSNRFQFRRNVFKFLNKKRELKNKFRRNVFAALKKTRKTEALRTKLRTKLNEQKEARTGRLQDFKYFEPKDNLRSRTYYVNRISLDSSNRAELRQIIAPRLQHALRTGITTRAAVHIKFILKDNGIVTSMPFNAFLIDDEKAFWELFQQWIDTHTSAHKNYTYTVTDIQIKIVKEGAGGCAPRNKTSKIGDAQRTQKKASNNNCAFNELFDLLNLGARMGKVVGNRIRKEFNLLEDSIIPITIVLKIYQKYRKDPNSMILITDDATLERFYSTPNTRADPTKTLIRELSLNNEHYSTITRTPSKKCPECGKKYVKTHTCNAAKVNFYNTKILKNKKRFLICSNQTEKYNNKDEILHYDLETYQKSKDGALVHTPYIVGYTTGQEFKSIEGKECMSKFVDVLLAESDRMTQEDKDKTLYVNAYNGSNFDHYCLVQEFLKKGLKPKKHIINNGSIISFEYLNIKLFDVCKHLLGGLDDNLKALGCKVQKGAFNHDDPRLLNGWEHMPKSLQEECMSYLEGDVMGLKELYDKLNTTVFDEDQVNISSYISTSSLTFNLWKRSIRSKFSIQLPNLEQEIAFRQSVRGGRTYKSKHNFVSKEYEGFKNGEIEFDEINDYCMDADVVSLYPAAMAKYPYPVGECKKWNGEEGKIGIYKIKYETNKNLMHSVGGRRVDKALKWDLSDSEGWYTSIDIEDMIDNGYKVEILEGWFWEKVEYVFKDYIDKLFTKKGKLATEGKKGTVEYLLSKLYMNGLYGKNIQRPIYVESKMIKNNTEYWKFWGTHHVKDITPIETGDGNVWIVSGTPKVIEVKEKCITKPTQLGAFILAYSRRIMLEYIKEANPHFDSTDKEAQVENDFYYTDTDSLQMHQTQAKRIKRLGDKSLGGITDDLGDKCKIIRGLWIAPKLYMLEYIKKGSPKLHYHFRGKGLSTAKLTVEIFESMDRGGSLTNTRDFQMKKIHIKRNSNQQNVEPFSILHMKDVSKVVNKTAWTGRNFTGNSSIPWV